MSGGDPVPRSGGIDGHGPWLQAPSQHDSPAPQCAPPQLQTLFIQLSPGAHFLPQAPQLLSSLARLLQPFWAQQLCPPVHAAPWGGQPQ
jgi:hypothetical protein